MSTKEEWLEQVEVFGRMKIPAAVLICGNEAKMLGLSVVFFGEAANEEIQSLFPKNVFIDAVGFANELSEPGYLK